MPQSTTPDAAADLHSLGVRWRSSREVVVLTGAGMSTASGIPDFRSPGGRWHRYQPVTIQAFDRDAASREEYWRYKGETWEVISRSQPNPGHLALSDLARAGHLDLLVTQNVDGLHERSGFPAARLITVHGTDSQVECRACGERQPRAVAQADWQTRGGVPRCGCGGWLKPATISFGQSLVAADLERAFDAAARCDLFVAIGTSLMVSPVNQLVVMAARAGAAIAILTASETPFDEVADWRFSRPVEELLPTLRELVLA